MMFFQSLWMLSITLASILDHTNYKAPTQTNFPIYKLIVANIVLGTISKRRNKQIPKNQCI
jgi:hypothetical protein